ncbi:MAG: hypothetical protein E6H93_08470 [Chloroflexi bacterium]|nr:MAG: hypothetical protein E6H93_08470 [Chloroflexota bacterium]
MKGWAQQLAGALLVLVFAAAVGGFVLLLRAQQGGLAASLAIAHIRAVSPPDGATNVPLGGEIRADYISRPSNDPIIKLEPPVGVTLDNPHWEGTTFVIEYHGLRDNSLYHAELDQDEWSGKGEHKQIKVRWAFRTGSLHASTPTPPISPKPVPSSSPSAMPNLIWYGFGDSNMVAKDWNGQPRGTSELRVAGQSPDGSKLLAADPTARIVDSAGNVLGTLTAVRSYVWWADDSSAMCMLGGNLRGDELEVVGVNGHWTAIASIPPPGSPQQVMKLAACSELNHRAIVYGYGFGNIYSLKLISLIDGHVIYQQTYPNPMLGLVASPDGQFVAEQFPGSPPITQIRQLPSGRIVGQLTGVYVHGFSWDGSIVGGDISGYAGPGQAQVIDWRTNRVLWRMDDSSFPVVLPRPFGTELAMAVWSPGSFTAGIYDIHADGRVVIIAAGRPPLQAF